MQASGPDDAASSGCPSCGLPTAPARTSGPLLCRNCGHRDPTTWEDDGEETDGEEGAIRVGLDDPDRGTVQHRAGFRWRPN